MLIDGVAAPNPDCPKPAPVGGVVVGALLAALRPKAAGWPAKAENAPPPPLGPLVDALGFANAENPPPVDAPNAPVAGLTSDDCPNDDWPNADVAGGAGWPNAEVGAGAPNADTGCVAGAPNADVGCGAGWPKADVTGAAAPNAEAG